MRTFLCLLLSLALPAAAQDEASTLSGLLATDNDAFARAETPRAFEFPFDHGPHPEYRNEWWYVTGNLDADGRRFGFELTIFRVALTPNSAETSEDWSTDQVYFAHFAVTDADGQRFFAAEKSARGAAGLAGARRDPYEVWIDNWRLSMNGDRWRLHASDEGFAVDLALTPEREPVLNGDAGLSQKSGGAGNASYYYSITRMAADGETRVDDRTFAVDGQAWLDREWSTSALADDQVGWDWFALQLDDGSDLMFYNLRLTDGQQDTRSAGTWVASDGTYRYVPRDDIEIDVTDTWESPDGGVYPSGWTLRMPSVGLDIEITPVLDEQELSTIVRYWEGAVDVSGKRNGRRISGVGYVELTGYAEDDN